MSVVHVSIDMEGIAGIAARSQVMRGSDDYPAGRELMTREANAAVEGAFAGGATRVMVSDSHGDMANLLPALMDPRAELIFGSPKLPWGMMQGISAEVDVCAFIGYHTPAGTPNGHLEHTYSSATFTEVEVNGETWSEARLNAAIAGLFDVPVGLVAGDDLTCAHAEALLPGVRTVAVKTAIGRTAVASLHPERACDAIRSAMAEVVAGADAFEVYRPAGPYTLEASMLTSVMAEACLSVPGAERVSARTVRYECPDVATVKQVISCWVALSAGVGR